jgi:hypothetical protein
MLGEDQRAVHLDVEDAAAPADQLGLGTESALKVGRQPGGPRMIVSRHAVLDGDAHAPLRFALNNTGRPGSVP